MEKIVIDGGPCSGKTTGLNKVAEMLLQKGIYPLIIPEAATQLIQSGLTPKTLGDFDFQKRIVELQLKHEEYWEDIAISVGKRTGKRIVLLCDRGLLTGSAYLPLMDANQLDVFQNVLKDFQLNVEGVRSRYLGVVHMVTAADGAMAYYTLANNSARTEDPVKAVCVDKRTQKAWLGHPHLAVISNTDKIGKSISFEQKIDNMTAEICRILGLPIPIELEDKFKLKSFDPKKLPVPYEAIDITQDYLIPISEGSEERVRARSWNRYMSYYHTIKSPGPKGCGRFEIERNISREEYSLLLSRKNLTVSTIQKTRHCFLWKDQYFEVDVFGGIRQGLILMEREKTDHNDTTELPDFIGDAEDVTDNKAYSNFNLASYAI